MEGVGVFFDCNDFSIFVDGYWKIEMIDFGEYINYKFVRFGYFCF